MHIGMMDVGTGRALGLILLLAMAAMLPVLLFGGESKALPQYTARSARTCDNCHVDPTGWVNPDYADRICTLSCSGCHVDPAGGGLRTVSGFYYGTQTLPAFGADRRPWADRQGHLFGLLPGRDYRDRFETGGVEPAPTSAPTTMPTSAPTTMPTTMPTSAPSHAGGGDREGNVAPEADRGPRVGDLSYLAWGHPVGEPSVHAYSQARYGGLNADPLVRLGGDARYAALRREPGWTFFPMQLDLTAAVHPVEHLTLYVEGAAWGGQTGAGTQINGEDVDLIGLHEAFVMAHEVPLNSFLKAGRFLPQYGTRLDDHTAFVRRNLGFDPSRPSSWVAGVEAGFNANYPYASLAVFRTDAGQTGFWSDDGTGASGTVGYRDLVWGLGGSGYWADTSAERRAMVGATWYLNPWRMWSEVPLTYLGELDWARVEAVGSAVGAANQIALFHELDWVPFNGVNVRVRYDYFDADVTVDGDHQHRLNEQVDVFLVRHTELQFVFRQHFAPRGSPSGDFLTIGRLWF